MSNKELIKKCNKALVEYHKKLNEVNMEGVKLFESFVKQLFELNPKLKSFSWPQYTPTWNDGDACNFGVYCDAETIKINGISYYLDEDDDDVEIEESAKKKLWKGIDNPEQLVEDICELIDCFDISTLEYFGEGEITFKRSGKFTCDDSVGDF